MHVTEEEYTQLLRRNRTQAVTAPALASKPAPAKPLATETEEQEALIEWARLHERTYPALSLLAHIPNGGSRHILEAKKLRRLGVLPGMPDLLLLYPARNYHGWAGEMKSATGTLSAAQSHILSQLKIYGYCAGTFYGWEQARDSLVWYLGTA